MCFCFPDFQAIEIFVWYFRRKFYLFLSFANIEYGIGIFNILAEITPSHRIAAATAATYKNPLKNTKQISIKVGWNHMNKCTYTKWKFNNERTTEGRESRISSSHTQKKKEWESQCLPNGNCNFIIRKSFNSITNWNELAISTLDDNMYIIMLTLFLCPSTCLRLHNFRKYHSHLMI